MARIAASEGNESEKQKYYKKLKELMHDVPVSFLLGMSLLGMGLDESARGNNAAAKKIFEDGLAIFDRMRAGNFQLIMKSELGHIARHTGDLAQARLIYQETILGWQKMGNRAATAHQLECFGYLAIAGEEPQRAARLFGAGEALREKAQTPMIDKEQVEYNQAVAQLRSMLDAAEFDTLWEAGRATSMEQAINFALKEE